GGVLGRERVDDVLMNERRIAARECIGTQLIVCIALRRTQWRAHARHSLIELSSLETLPIGELLFSASSHCYVSTHPRFPVSCAMQFTVETEREEDGRWIAEVPDLAGVLAYGTTRDEALARAQTLALRVLADRVEHAEAGPDLGA